MIKAIETKFMGYRFRSRLEARWAVFLESLAVEWAYEPEGFNLDGVLYLPDFYVESWGSFIEIKPSEMDELEKEKCVRLAEKAPVIAIQGNCWPGEYTIQSLMCNESHEMGGEDLKFAEFGTCRKCEAIVLVEGRDYCGHHQIENCIPPCENWCDKYPIGTEYSTRLKKAFTAARSARFEHGESPRI